MRMARHRSRSRPARWRGSVAFSGVGSQRGEALDARGHRPTCGIHFRAPMFFVTPRLEERGESRDAVFPMKARAGPPGRALGQGPRRHPSRMLRLLGSAFEDSLSPRRIPAGPGAEAPPPGDLPKHAATASCRDNQRSRRAPRTRPGPVSHPRTLTGPVPPRPRGAGPGSSGARGAPWGLGVEAQDTNTPKSINQSRCGMSSVPFSERACVRAAGASRTHRLRPRWGAGTRGGDARRFRTRVPARASRPVRSC